MEAIAEWVLAPAKVNLYLRILGRRPDGYHLLDSLMVPVSLHDELRIRVDRQGRSRPDGGCGVAVTSDYDAAPGGPSNLAHRAATLFLAQVDHRATVEVHIRKRIPVGSGLGGGSSDAAAVLVALNRLFGRPLGIDELAAVGSQIGADVTFFVHGRPARVGGVGEQVSPFHLPAALSLVLCWDRYALSTKLVYSRVDLSLTSRSPASNIQPSVSAPTWDSGWLVNDLEPAAAQIHPEVLSLKARLLKQGARGALMTGSGAAVFGVWPDYESACSAATQLRQHGLWAEAVQTLAASPGVEN